MTKQGEDNGEKNDEQGQTESESSTSVPEAAAPEASSGDWTWQPTSKSAPEESSAGTESEVPLTTPSPQENSEPLATTPIVDSADSSPNTGEETTTTTTTTVPPVILGPGILMRQALNFARTYFFTFLMCLDGCPVTKVGTVFANSAAEGGLAGANAVSTKGGDVIANANNGSRAVANALTKCAGDAQANTKTYGEGGARSNAFAKGTGTALGNAVSYGQGEAAANADASGGNAKTNAFSLGGG